MILGILTTIWKRPTLTASVLSYYASMSLPGVEIVRVAVGSEGIVSRQIAEASGFDYVETPNEPLSDKHNAGLPALASADRVMVVGSDDLVCPSWITTALRYDAAVVTKRGLHVSDGEAIWFAPLVVTGAGALYTREAISSLGDELWAPGLDRGLDKSAAIRAAAFGGWTEVSDGGPVLDIKTTDVNRFGMKDVHRWGAMRIALASEWMPRHFPGIKS